MRGMGLILALGALATLVPACGGWINGTGGTSGATTVGGGGTAGGPAGPGGQGQGGIAPGGDAGNNAGNGAAAGRAPVAGPSSTPFILPPQNKPGTTFPGVGPDSSPVTTTIVLTQDATGDPFQTQFENALRSAGHVVIDSRGTQVTFTPSRTLVIPDGLSGKLVLDGQGTVTLDGTVSGRILQKGFQDDLTVQGLTFANGHVSGDGTTDGSSGAAINMTTWDGYLTAIDCAFVNCTAASSGPDLGGGAIRVLGQRTMTLSGCTFTNCSASNGGAVVSLGGEVLLLGCTFTNNRATGTGGGADAGPSGQGGIGGAFYMDGDNSNANVPRLVISGCTFSGNIANVYGGAVFAYQYPGTDAQTIVDASTFDQNSALAGKGGGFAGGLYTQNGTITIANSTFSGNTAGAFGGALWENSADGMLLQNSTFTGNSSGQVGGAMTLGSGEVEIENCTIANNQSTGSPTGGIFAGGCPGKVSSTILANNTGISGTKQNTDTTFADGGGNVQYPWTSGQGDPLITSGAVTGNPLLGPLAPNGGPTQTLSIPNGSPAYGAGRADNSLPLDQRGNSRGPRFDSGAYQAP